MLKVGDVIKLKKGHSVYMKIPYKFIFKDVDEKSNEANDIYTRRVQIGEIYKTSKKTFKTKNLIGEYVATRAEYEGGGAGHGSGDVYSDGYHIICRKLLNGKWDSEGIELGFYQSGSFSACSRETSPV